MSINVQYSVQYSVFRIVFVFLSPNDVVAVMRLLMAEKYFGETSCRQVIVTNDATIATIDMFIMFN